MSPQQVPTGFPVGWGQAVDSPDTVSLFVLMSEDDQVHHMLFSLATACEEGQGGDTRQSPTV